MTPWYIAIALYFIGAVGFHVMATDINKGPIRSKLVRARLLIWPLVIVYGTAGDLWDKARGRGPYWTGR